MFERGLDGFQVLENVGMIEFEIVDERDFREVMHVMIFTETVLAGAFIIDIEPRSTTTPASSWSAACATP